MNMELIYAQYRGKVLSYIRSRVGSFADAEDLCEDVFEKIQNKLGEYDESKAKISTWIYTITHNSVIDYYRRTRPSGELDENMASEDEVSDNLLSTETLSELAQALKKLPQQMRDIIVLRYYDGKPLTEISEIMGLSYGATKLRHAGALQMLKELMRS